MLWSRTALIALVAGCSTLMIDSLEQLRDNNRKNIAELALGTPRAQVEKLMGDAAAGGKLGDVLFYYTDLKTRDDRITDDELTPLVFRNHELAGIGYGFLAKLAPKYRPLQ